MRALRESEPSAERVQPVIIVSKACLNCDAPLTGPFCAACGQRDIPPYPSVRELAADAVSELSGWDGRLATTIRALIRRPGKLTRDFLQGRRARSISPLRLYLTASLVYFVLAAAAPDVKLQSGKKLFFGLYVSGGAEQSATVTGSDGNASSTNTMVPIGSELTSAEREAALEAVAEAPALLQPLMRQVFEDPVGFKRGMVETLPRTLFALLPAFAAIVGLVYRGRKYPEHLYFAIHLHAFFFLALAVIELLKFTESAGLVAAVAIPILVAAPVYTTLAFRRVYGGSLVATLAKEVVIAVLYGATSFAALAASVLWVSIVSRP
jgi:hypothetical protein